MILYRGFPWLAVIVAANAQAQMVEHSPQDLQAQLTAQPVIASPQTLQQQAPRESAQPVSVTAKPMLGTPSFVAETEALPDIDTRPVWNFLHNHDYLHAHNAMLRLQQQNPAWKVPDDLQHMLDQEEITDARDHRRMDAIRASAAAHPGLFNCASVYNLWTLANADFALHDDTGGTDVYRRIIGECDEKSVLSTLDQASGTLSAIKMKPLLAQADQRSLSAAAKQHLATLRTPHSDGPDVGLVANLLAKGQDVQANHISATLTPQITHSHQYAAATQLGWIYFNAHHFETSDKWFGLALHWHATTNSLKGAVLSAAAQKHWQSLETLAKQHEKYLTPEIRKMLGGMFAQAAGMDAKNGDVKSARHDAEIAQSYGNNAGWAPAGWAFLNANHPAEALALFAHAPDSDAIRTGKAIALQHTGDLAGAEHIACSDPVKPLAPCGGIPSQLADDAFKARQWNDVRRWAAEALHIKVADRGIEMENAWSAYHQKHYHEAATLFADQYQTHPDRDAADGLVASLRADNRMAEAKQLAGEDAGPLADSYHHSAAETYYDRKQFIAADAIALPGQHPELEGISGAQAGTGIGLRDRQGAAGQDRVQAVSGYVQGSQSFGNNTLDTRVENASYHIGTPHPGDAVGSVTGSWTHSPTTSADLTTPTVRFSHQDDVAYTVELGTTPLGGAVNGRLAGDASVTLHNTTNAVTGTLFSQPRLDSLLSASGMTDPVTGKHWGRVVESGGQASGYTDLGNNWSLSGQGLVSTLDGSDVVSNTRVSLGTALSYTLHAQGLDYLRVGPAYLWESYSKDASHFTFGQGGYYSPEQLNLPYISAELLTSEAKNFQLWGQANLGWDMQTERASPYFPQMPNGQYFAGSQSSGVSSYEALRAAYLLSPHWIANAYVWASTAPNYREAAVGFGISYSFDGRAAAMSSDLPDRYGQPRF